MAPFTVVHGAEVLVPVRLAATRGRENREQQVSRRCASMARFQYLEANRFNISSSTHLVAELTW